MSLFIDASFECLNKYNEELCGDKVEILRGENTMTIVLADGLGSGVKANILATLTSKIIGTMLGKGATIDEAVETIASTLPVCRERDIAYSTFSILQIDDSGQGYLAEFDNPAVLRLCNGKLTPLIRQEREISGKRVQESRFSIAPEDLFVLFSDGVVHAGIGGILNLGWQWENVAEYVERTYSPGLSARNIAKLLLSACENLYMQHPGDDTTVVAVKARKPVKVSVMVGPPVDRSRDRMVVEKFLAQEGKKVVCGGTTSQIFCRETGRKMSTGFHYINPAIPPTADIEGINLATEGVLTLGKAMEYTRKYISSQNTVQDFISLNKQDGASRLAKILLEEGTEIYFLVGRAMNPAHQNPELPLSLGLKLKLVEELAENLKSIGKKVTVEYY